MAECMRTFFRGWRRKAGVAALVVALALMAVWIRSTIVLDSILIITNNGASNHEIISAAGEFRWDYYTGRSRRYFGWLESYPMWGVYPLRSIQAESRMRGPWDPEALADEKEEYADFDDGTPYEPAERPKNVRWKWGWCGLKLGTGAIKVAITPTGLTTPLDFRATAIPYWILTVPLTLLAAYLILWKPPKPFPS